ncbi:UNKNOWN [Stylonychia lemnae]|uniref:Transmembrane protein n=1 Tax=Stylonychia lemnae TaxID=5949 RepID=A0A077ZSE0_STYLE|nr:UNKNOWN [Stylonychia lemnae]|eukprot:CDW72280.1 UNKNOWN [Stylonychia lemnae]
MVLSYRFNQPYSLYFTSYQQDLLSKRVIFTYCFIPFINHFDIEQGPRQWMGFIPVALVLIYLCYNTAVIAQNFFRQIREYVRYKQEQAILSKIRKFINDNENHINDEIGQAYQIEDENSYPYPFRLPPLLTIIKKEELILQDLQMQKKKEEVTIEQLDTQDMSRFL